MIQSLLSLTQPKSNIKEQPQLWIVSVWPMQLLTQGHSFAKLNQSCSFSWAELSFIFSSHPPTPMFLFVCFMFEVYWWLLGLCEVWVTMAQVHEAWFGHVGWKANCCSFKVMMEALFVSCLKTEYQNWIWLPEIFKPVGWKMFCLFWWKYYNRNNLSEIKEFVEN